MWGSDRHRPNHRIIPDYPSDHSRISMASPVRLARNQAIAMVGMGPDVPEATYRCVIYRLFTVSLYFLTPCL